MENNMDAPQNFKNRTTTSGIYPKELKLVSCRDISTPMIIARLFTIAKMWKQPKRSSTDEWIKKM